MSKSILLNNHYINTIFFQMVKASRNKKEIFNWLFNLYFFLTVLFYIYFFLIYFLIYLLFKKYSILLIIPLTILSSFFLVVLKSFKNNKYTTVKISTFLLYAILFSISYNLNSFNFHFVIFFLINFLEIFIIYFLLIDQFNFKINLEYIKDFRNLTFIKKFIKLFYKSQVIKIFFLLILIFFFISVNNLITVNGI